MSDKLDKIEKLIMLLIDKVDNMEERFEKRFDGLEARLDGVEARLDGVEVRLDGVETRLDGVETRFDGLETRFDELEERITYENKMTRQAIMELSETMDNNYIELKSEIKHLSIKQEQHEKMFQLLSRKTFIQEEKSEYDPD